MQYVPVLNAVLLILLTAVVLFRWHK